MSEENQQPVKGKRGGRKPGSGRPKGAKSHTTIEREYYFNLWKKKTEERSKSLLNAQMMLALGTIKVFKVVTTEDSKGRVTRSKPQLVASEDEIVKALDYEFGDGESPNDNENYYFVSIKDPDNSAINSLIDRTFGKAKESIDVNHSGTISLSALLGKGALDSNNENK